MFTTDDLHYRRKEKHAGILLLSDSPPLIFVEQPNSCWSPFNRMEGGRKAREGIINGLIIAYKLDY